MNSIPKTYIDLKEAADIVGRWKFGTEWSGKELNKSATGLAKKRREQVEDEIAEIIADGSVPTVFRETEFGTTRIPEPGVALARDFAVLSTLGTVGHPRFANERDECFFKRSDLDEYLKRLAKDPSRSTRRRRGPIPVYNWEEIGTFMIEWVKANKHPKSRADLVKAVQQHCEHSRSDEKSPSQRLIYKRIDELGLRKHFTISPRPKP